MTSLARKAAIAILTLFAATTSASSQGPPAKEAPRIRIAAVNYGYVFTNYDRAIQLKKDLDKELEPLKAEAEKIKSGLVGLKAAEQNSAQVPEALQIVQKHIQESINKLTELDATARKLVGKKQEQQLVELWIDVNAAIKEYAEKRDYDLVLGYGDPPVVDPKSFAMVSRKMTVLDTGATIPAYIRNGADVTTEVSALLNEKYRASKHASKKAAE
jgi:Skp family chaperone for outer membrane proteins